MNRLRDFRRPKGKWRGTLSVEIAAVTPILIILVYGSIELHRINMIRSSVDNAAYEGARAVTVPGATSNQATAAAQQILDAVGIRNATITVTPETILPETAIVEVAINVPLSDNSFGLVPYLTTRTLEKRCALQRSAANR
ncbi:TadE/TadG family type IV pilus assembly protein [Fuerstiella marisgermanici]|uniref:Flp pilus assembly protein n=1 Tax=Fuerstiella marisgermanici TaxID=1891926 RepID=A0A1P8WQQ2_9PLAN|nr:TadE/TadG family type IV pilus assembly protein [Fuerstiella marisgermanici]APZ96395.1 Flp pilus assembly protein [Fuerstiella marisgermanici]